MTNERRKIPRALSSGGQDPGKVRNPAEETWVDALCVVLTVALAAVGVLALCALWGCALPQPLGASYSTGSNGGHGSGWVSGSALRNFPGLELQIRQQCAKRLSERVARVPCLATSEVADGGLAAPASTGDLRLTQAVRLYLRDDLFPIHAARISDSR